MEENKSKSVALGSNAYLTKPLNSHSLFEALHQHAGIEWVYPQSARGHRPQEVSIRQDDEIDRSKSEQQLKLKVPPIELLDELLSYAQVGDVAALQSIALEILEQDQAFSPFVNQLQAFINNFKVKEIEEWVTKLIKEQTAH